MNISLLTFAGYGHLATRKIRIWMHISEPNIPANAKQSKPFHSRKYTGISVVYTFIFILSFVTFKASVKIMQIFSDDIEVEEANPGENLKLKVTGVEEEVKFTRYPEFKWSWEIF